MTQPFEVCNRLSDLPTDERLRYVLGQVLGVQDFRQEQVYHLYKNRLHNRSLHGYGTVSGLDVSTTGTDETLEIQVEAGLAVDPCGQEIVVHQPQCARINRWLGESIAGKTNAQRLIEAAGAGAQVRVYVSLCYTECLTGEQPVFGDPCRVDSDAIQPTRIKDDFRLDLLAAPPVQTEEDFIRRVGALLGRVEVTPAPATPTPPEDAVELTSAMTDVLDDPELLDNPALVFELPRDVAAEVLREVLRYWVVHTRPALAPAESEAECGVLLAAVEFALTGTNTVDETTITIDQSMRPYLLQTRLLQEWLFNGAGLKGEKGDKGDQGEKGEKGDQGDKGDPGEKGEKGDKGDPGEPGTPGTPGTPGEKGDPGTPGEKGEKGDKGDPGEPGTPGTPGTPGEKGDKGDPGDPGTPGIPGTPGEKGDKGDKGDKGEPGSSTTQAFISAPMMFRLKDNARLVLVGPANPAWLIPIQGGVAFQWGRPRDMEQNSLFLRFFWTGDTEGEIAWEIGWRWTEAIKPGDGPNPPITSLGPRVTGQTDIMMKTFRPDGPGSDELQLHISEEVHLPNELGGFAGDYLQVSITFRDGAGVERVSLLMAELSWKNG